MYICMCACACAYTCVCATRVLVSSLPGNVRQRVRPVSAALPADVIGFGKRRMMERKKKSKKRKAGRKIIIIT